MQLALFDIPNEDASLLELNKLADKALLIFNNVGIERVDIPKLKKRFDLLGIEDTYAMVFLLFCMRLDRDQAAVIITRGKSCVDKNHLRLAERIGIFNEVTLIDILTCSDERYFTRYFHYIENNRALYNANYIKKTKM